MSMAFPIGNTLINAYILGAKILCTVTRSITSVWQSIPHKTKPNRDTEQNTVEAQPTMVRFLPLWRTEIRNRKRKEKIIRIGEAFNMMVCWTEKHEWCERFKPWANLFQVDDHCFEDFLYAASILSIYSNCTKTGISFLYIGQLLELSKITIVKSYYHHSS